MLGAGGCIIGGRAIIGGAIPAGGAATVFASLKRDFLFLFGAGAGSAVPPTSPIPRLDMDAMDSTANGTGRLHTTTMKHRKTNQIQSRARDSHPMAL